MFFVRKAAIKGQKSWIVSQTDIVIIWEEREEEENSLRRWSRSRSPSRHQSSKSRQSWTRGNHVVSKKPKITAGSFSSWLGMAMVTEHLLAK